MMIKSKIFIISTIALSILLSVWASEAIGQDSFADQWEYVGIAVEEPGYTIWGTSPIIGEDGKTHLFVARWPCELNVDPGWRTHSEIAHYVGDSPEGPFVFSDVAVKGDIGGKEGKAPCNPAIHKVKCSTGIAPHNPTIHKVDSLYALFYIANDGVEDHPSNQYICLSVSESLNGPWKKAGSDGVILRPPSNENFWNYNASNGVNNPAFIQHPDGGFYLYFKSEKARMGMAFAENLEGPYVQLPFPVTANDSNIEDGYAFMHKGKFALLTTDNHGMIESGGGILWTSDDGIHFDKFEKGFHRINKYTKLDMSKVATHYGPGGRQYAKFERPQILMNNGKPSYLYVPSGTNIYGGECTVSYVLKNKNQHQPWTFVSMPDFLNVDCDYPEPRWEDALSYILESVKMENPDFLVVAGDMVMGEWDGPEWNDKDSIAKYSKRYYSAWKNRMDAHGIKYYTTIGDHEIGDNDWVTQKRLEAVGMYKEAFAKHLKMPQNGPAHMKGTAFWWRHKNVLFISTDIFEEGKSRNGFIKLGVTGEQLAWVKQILEENADADHKIVLGHAPILGPVRKWSSSALMVDGGRDSDFWQTMKDYSVDAYLCGEVHAITCKERDGVMQVAHGGLLGYNTRTNYMVCKVYNDKIELEIKEIEILPAGEHKWQPGGNRPLENVSISQDIKDDGFYSVGTVSIDKTDGKEFKNRKGYFLPHYESSNETAVPIFKKENKRGLPIELQKITIEKDLTSKLSNKLIEIRIDKSQGSFDIYDLKNKRFIVKESAIGFTTKPYVDLEDLGRIGIETDKPETRFVSGLAQNRIIESSELKSAFEGGKSISLVSKWEDSGELEVQFTLYPDSSFVDIGFSFNNLDDQPVRLVNIDILNGTFLPELPRDKMKILEGNSGAGSTSVLHDGISRSENNILCYFPDQEQTSSLVAGALTFEDYRKWVNISGDTIIMSAADIVGKRIDSGIKYLSGDRFYLDGLIDNPFESLEIYAEITKKARGLDINYYTFPSVCMWFLSVTHFGADATSENSTVGAVAEMENIRESEFLKYSTVAIRLVPDNYEQDNEQGWWDNEHWQRHGRDYRCVVDHHYKKPYETTKKWASKILEMGGIPLTYFQPGIRSEDYANAFPGHMLYNESQRFVRKDKKVVSDPHVLMGVGGIPDLLNSNDWIDGWGKLYAEGYDYTDPDYLKHWREVNINLHTGGVKGVFYDYPSRVFAQRGGLEDRYSTALNAYRNVFRIPHEILGSDAYLQERLGVGSDASLEFVNSVRTEGDTNVITTRILNKAGNRWYKNRFLTNYDMDGKALVDAGHGDHRYEISSVQRKSILTLSYAVSGRLLLTESFSRFSEEVLHDLSRVFPFHSTSLSPRPLHAFIGGMPVLDFPISKDWHQVILYNDSDKTEDFNLALSGNSAFGALGLDANREYYLYDFWNDKFLSKVGGDENIEQNVSAGEARMISVHAVEDYPQWISTNRHVLQGYVDLVKKPVWDSSANKLSGVSRVIGKDSYKITIALNGYNPDKVDAKGVEIQINVRPDNSNLADVHISSKKNKDVSWEIYFTKHHRNTSKALGKTDTELGLHSEGGPWQFYPAKEKHSDLKKVLLVGNSVMNGFHNYVIDSLKGIADVDYWLTPKHLNSEFLFSDLEQVVSSEDYDVIQFNIGLHGWPEGRIKDEDYVPLLEKYVQTIKENAGDAELIWASITPVTEEGIAELNKEINPTIAKRNVLAEGVMRKHNVEVNDLYGLVADQLHLAKLDRFHWKAEGYQIMADQSVTHILQKLEDKKLKGYLNSYNVRWDSPSINSMGSMPAGNGDIGINLWVEENGDLLFYLSKTDAWSENARLLKIGKVRLSLSPNPFKSGIPFSQELVLEDGVIHIETGEQDEKVAIDVWVDANNPVVELDIQSALPIEAKISTEPWRTEARVITDKSEMHSAYGLKSAVVSKDIILGSDPNSVIWAHRNERSTWGANMELQGLEGYMKQSNDPLMNNTFGALIHSDEFQKVSTSSLKNTTPSNTLSASIIVHTAQTETLEDWMGEIKKIELGLRPQSKVLQRAQHEAWWKAFWNRSYIHVSTQDESEKEKIFNVTRGYALQRYMNACSGRGNSPIKFNGSIFTVDTKDLEGKYHGFDADYRQWGGPYWWQNTRLPYWSMLEAGDFDMMLPLFKMYKEALEVRKFATQKYYGHDGAFYPETMRHWGTYVEGNYGEDRSELPLGMTQNRYIRYYWQGGLELSLMMLDYYAFTKDDEILKETILPVVTEVMTFFDQHWERDDTGKILFDPAMALETYRVAVNPLVEIVGINRVCSELLKLPESVIDKSQRKQYERLITELPDIPMREVDGETLLAPAQEYSGKQNVENPELYAVFPYRRFGVGKENLELAVKTFKLREARENRGWQQHSIKAAYLGLTEEAANLMSQNFNASTTSYRFPTMWGPNYDWTPDQCHGSVAMTALQRMLVQYEGDEIYLFAAWPDIWDVDFKLKAPKYTSIEGNFKNGKISSLKVSPIEREKNIILKND